MRSFVLLSLVAVFTSVSLAQAQHTPQSGGSLGTTPQPPQGPCNKPPVDNVQAADGGSTGFITVAWNLPAADPANPIRHIKLMRASEGSPWKVIALLSKSTSSYNDNLSLIQGNSYQYQAVVQYTCGVSLASNTDAGFADIAAPSIVDGVNVSGRSQFNAMNVSWETPASDLLASTPNIGGPINGYLVSVSLSTPEAGDITDVGNANTCNVTDLEADQEYMVYVRSYGPGGQGAWSAGVAVSVQAPAPSDPSNLQASNDMADAIALTWTNGDTEWNSGYYIFRSETPNPQDMIQIDQIEDAVASSYVDTNVSMNQSYHYWVQSYGAGGEGNQVGPVTGSTTCPTPDQVNGVNASDGESPTVINVSWNAANGVVEHYMVYRTTDNNLPICETEPIATVEGTQLNITDNTVNPGTTYYYCVRAAGTCGEGVCSIEDAGFAQPPTGPETLLSEDFNASNSWPAGWTASGTQWPVGSGHILWHLALPTECSATSNKAVYNLGDTGVCNYKTGFAANSGNLFSLEFVVPHAQVTVSGIYTKGLDAIADNVSVSLLDMSSTTDFVVLANLELPNTSIPTPFNKTITLPAEVIGHSFKLHFFFAADGIVNTGLGFTVDDLIVTSAP